MAFDAYHKWLGIPPGDQPPHHYRLLGIALLESDPDVIDAAADRQMGYLRNCASGSHAAESQKLLNEVSAARLCLLHDDRKAAYDATLHQAPQRQPRSVLDAIDALISGDLQDGDARGVTRPYFLIVGAVSLSVVLWELVSLLSSGLITSVIVIVGGVGMTLAITICALLIGFMAVRSCTPSAAAFYEGISRGLSLMACVVLIFGILPRYGFFSEPTQMRPLQLPGALAALVNLHDTLGPFRFVPVVLALTVVFIDIKSFHTLLQGRRPRRAARAASASLTALLFLGLLFLTLVFMTPIAKLFNDRT